MRKILSSLTFSLLVFSWLHAQPSLKKMQDAFRAVKSGSLIQPEMTVNEKMVGQASIRFRGPSGLKTTQAVSWLKTQAGFRQGSDDLLADPTGLVTVRNIRIEKFQQYYQNIIVEHGRVNMSSSNDLVSAMQLELYTVPATLKTRPTISESAALAKAMAYVGAKKYPWDDYGGNDPAFAKPAGTLVIVEDIFRKVGTLCLAYKFIITADEPMSKAYVYVNAENGAVVFLDAIIKHVGKPGKVTGNPGDKASFTPSPLINATSSAQTRYSGSQALITDMRDTSYHLRELRNGDSIITLNQQRRTNSIANKLLAVDFNDLDNNWTSAEFDNATWDNVALDAHFGIEKVSDYWNTVQGRRGWDDAHGKMISYVHLRSVSTANYDNAFWDGVAMNYGDGTYLSGNTTTGFLPLTSLDVTAHEMGHGVCAKTANLVYQRESGGLNEGFSDIWAACVEHFANLGGAKRDFLIGEEIYPARGFLRSMISPNLASNPDTYGGSFWTKTTLDGCPVPINNSNDNCGVHNNSGVLNKWFYLLTQGEIGITDFGNRYNITGLGFARSEKIAYLTELMLTPNSDFAAARVASIDAAIALYGVCSLEVIEVTNAWFAVGVGSSSTCSPQVEFEQGFFSISEGGETNNGCSGKVYNVPVRLPAAASAAITMTFLATGTAAPNIDYSLPGNTLVFAPGETGIKNFPVTILDDGSNDGTKTLFLSYTTNNGGGNGGAGVNNQVCQLSIIDNDVLPARIVSVPITVSTLINETFESNPNTYPADWSESRFTPATVFGVEANRNKWIVGDKGGAGISGQSAYISGDTINRTATYVDSLVAYRGLNMNPISTRNLVNLKLSFRCKANGEFVLNTPNGSSLFDYGALYYSINGGAPFLLGNPATGDQYTFYGHGSDAFDVGPLLLPTSLNNQTSVRLGFLWFNDGGVAGNPGFVVDDIVVTGQSAGSSVKSSANQPGSTRVLSGAYNSYLYSTLDSQLIARISNVNQNLGCVTGTVTTAGNGKRVIQGMENYNATQKVVQLSPATDNTTANNTVYLYYTNDELAIWNGNKTKMKMMKIRSGVDLNGPISTADVQMVDPVVVDSSATTGIISYSGNFTGFSQYVLVEPLTALPVTMRDIKVAMRSQDAKLNWETEAEVNNRGYEVLRSFDGVQFDKIGFVDGKGNLTGISTYEFIDPKVPANITIYYRIRQVDLDQRSMLSRVVSTRLGSGLPMFISIWPNPAGEVLNISFAARVTKGKISILSPEGQLVAEYPVSTPMTSLPVKLGKIPAGLYLIRFTDGVRNETQKFLKK